MNAPKGVKLDRNADNPIHKIWYWTLLINQNSDKAWYYDERAKQLLKLNKFDLALEDGEKVLELNSPESRAGWLLKAAALLGLNKFE